MEYTASGMVSPSAQEEFKSVWVASGNFTWKLAHALISYGTSWLYCHWSPLGPVPSFSQCLLSIRLVPNAGKMKHQCAARIQRCDPDRCCQERGSWAWISMWEEVRGICDTERWGWDLPLRGRVISRLVLLWEERFFHTTLPKLISRNFHCLPNRH